MRNCYNYGRVEKWGLAGWCHPDLIPFCAWTTNMCGNFLLKSSFPYWFTLGMCRTILLSSFVFDFSVCFFSFIFYYRKTVVDTHCRAFWLQPYCPTSSLEFLFCFGISVKLLCLASPKQGLTLIRLKTDPRIKISRSNNAVWALWKGRSCRRVYFANGTKFPLVTANDHPLK